VLAFFAFTSAHLSRCAAAIFLRAAALMVRFALTGFEGFDFAFIAAHLFLCAAAILPRAAGLSGRLLVGSAQGPAFRLRNQASAGCQLSCLRHSASSAGIRSMRLRARMRRLFFGLWACISISCISVLLIRSYLVYLSDGADYSSVG
jgi:hypothetical protein